MVFAVESVAVEQQLSVAEKGHYLYLYLDSNYSQAFRPVVFVLGLSIMASTNECCRPSMLS